MSRAIQLWQHGMNVELQRRAFDTKKESRDYLYWVNSMQESTGDPSEIAWASSVQRKGKLK